MDTINLRHQFYLHRKQKIIVLLLVGFLWSLNAHAQNAEKYNKENLPNYDKELIHYGFFLGVHWSEMKLRYSDQYQNYDSLHSIIPEVSPGFSLGFIVNLRLAQYLDLRALPRVGLYQYTLDYNTIQQGKAVVVKGQKETFYAGVPIMFKYKSQRRKNFRMYMVGGLTPSYEVSGRKNADQPDEERLLIQPFDLSMEIGFGVDIYYPLFKFSPEIRFSRGVFNALSPKENPYSRPIDKLLTNSVSIYFQFQ